MGHYLDTQGKKYIIVEDNVETERGEELNALQEHVIQLQGEKSYLEEMLDNTEVQKNLLTETLINLNDAKSKVESSILNLRKEKERIEMERRFVKLKVKDI